MNQAAWQLYERLPVPTRRDVDWQHFDLRALKLAGVEKQAQSVNVSLSAGHNHGTIVCDLPTALVKHADLVNAHLGRSIPASEPQKFAALHNALWETGAFVYVPRNTRLTTPIEITYDCAFGFPRSLIVIEPGAEATVVQKYIGNPTLHASGTEVYVKEGAKLHYVSMQNFAPTAYDFTLKRAHVARDAEIDWVIGMFGGGFARYDVECIMEGEGGTSYMYGVGIGEGKQQLGQFTRQHHTVGNTVSDLLFKNVLRDQAVSNYAGTIKVEKHSNGTNAYQSNRNLILSDTVQCDTRPILEIESNQLRCTHGATVGRLDENQLFYLRSRGLAPVQARQMLIEAFLEPVLARIQVDPVREEFARLIHQKVLR